MSKGQYRVETNAQVGSTTIFVSGESIHTSREAHTCAELLAEVLDTLGYKGEFKVVASMQRLKGSSHLQGLSTKCVSINAVQLGYQPGGNDRRATYTLQLSNAEEAQKCFVVLKEYLGTAYNGESGASHKPAQEQDESEVVPVAAATNPVVEQPSMSIVKPTQVPAVYYTKDPDWMLTFLLHLSCVADSESLHQVTKDQVLNLIVAHTHYPDRRGTAAIYTALFCRGYLQPVPEVVDKFIFVESPAAGFKGSRPWAGKQVLPKALPTPRLAKGGRRNMYLSDEEWVRSCMEELSALVESGGGLISRSELRSFLKRKTNQKKIAGVVTRVYDGLVLKGYVISEGDMLRVSYQPKPGTLEKAVAGIKQARAQVAKVFDGFAKYRLPTFAEGMFENTQLLDEFLSKVHGGVQERQQIQKLAAHWYPGLSGQSYLNLFNYMVGQGYLVRQKLGKYALGPKGLTQLGLPPVSYQIVDMMTQTGEKPVKEEIVPTVAIPAPAPLQAFLPPAQASAPLVAAEPSSITLALAKLAKEGLELGPKIASAEGRVAALRERKAAAELALQSTPDIDQLVQRRLLEEIAKM